MITAPTNYSTVYADASHYAEVKLIVGGARTEYGESHILSLRTSMSLFGESLSIGNVIVNQFQATLVGVTPSNIPKMTRVEIWCRIRKSGMNSGWFPKGVFYTKKPAYEPELGVLKIEGYDPMFLLEQTPYPTGVIVAWGTETMRSVASTLATAVGIPLEDSTQVETYDFPAPPYGYTAREIFSQIAIACGGNWMLTYVDTSSGGNLAVTPKLRLRKFIDIVQSQALGRTIQSFNKADPVQQITHVILDYGINAAGATMYKESAATPDDGRTIEYEIPVITDGVVVQDIADDLLTALGSLTYDPFTAGGAMVNPLMEIGDAVTCNGCTALFGSIDTNFGRGMFCDIAAPGIPEKDDFPYMTQSQRETDREKRTNATNSARITVNADAITAEVVRANDAEEALNSDIRTTLTQTADALEARITTVETDLEGHANEQSRYIRYGNGKLEMGTEGSQTKATLTDTKLGFTDPTGDEKAYIGQDPNDNVYKFFVINGHIVNKLELGDHWDIVASGAESDYRLTIRWRS